MALLQMPTAPNLTDAFDIIPKDQFPDLWRFAVRLLTILPTTVPCEQSFSYFKRTRHINMSEQTAKTLLYWRMSLYNYNYNL